MFPAVPSLYYYSAICTGWEPCNLHTSYLIAMPSKTRSITLSKQPTGWWTLHSPQDKLEAWTPLQHTVLTNNNSFLLMSLPLHEGIDATWASPSNFFRFCKVKFVPASTVKVISEHLPGQLRVLFLMTLLVNSIPAVQGSEANCYWSVCLWF